MVVQVGLVWFGQNSEAEFNTVSESVSESVSDQGGYRAARAAKKERPPFKEAKNLSKQPSVSHLDFALCSSTWLDRSEICLLSSSQSEDMPQPNSSPISGK